MGRVRLLAFRDKLVRAANETGAQDPRGRISHFFAPRPHSCQPAPSHEDVPGMEGVGDRQGVRVAALGERHLRLAYTSGQLWTQNGTWTPPVLQNCGGVVCSDGTCTDCLLSPTEKEAALRADQQRFKQSKCCSLCAAQGTLLLGLQIPVCRDCSDQAEALGLFAPHKSHGVGGKACAGNGSRDSHTTLCSACKDIP